MNNVNEIFGSMVFNETVMKTRLPKDIYKSLKNTIHTGKPLDISIANVIATVMKEWATERGATHFTHWFQPMTGITAEKHDSFISPTDDGRIIMEFNGKELIKGESDASGFPSGGLRATFEARGYTAWDPTSYAFVKDRTLYIPTAFCSYGGEALDKKTPLLRSMRAINTQAMRILKLFGRDDVKQVFTTVGSEQEYFLIDEEMFSRRKDLQYTGRTLFGARPPKGQEQDDHYFGVIQPRVKEFMADLDEELWKLGVLAKTEHNEAAPAQHELAPIFTTANISTDHNQITMELMKKIAKKHGLACLLHEKPFAGMNGSGKHNNWSLCTDTGYNLLEPGKSPHDNAQFLLFLCAVLKAVDEYGDLIRISAASAGNDYRLGGNEAPPAVISVFLGDELTEILKAIESKSDYSKKEKVELEIGVDILPHIPKDTTDRNRTSPFAFTGNKFEFRMLGSSMSIAGPNIVLNTVVAEELSDFADILENAQDFTAELNRLIRHTIRDHKRVVFNGNNYSAEWEKEAKRRGLLNLKNTPEALATFTKEKNIRVFSKHAVFTQAEMYSRLEILYESYIKAINTEALTMIDMTVREIIPAVASYQKEVASVANEKRAFLPDIDVSVESELLKNLSDDTVKIKKCAEILKKAVDDQKQAKDTADRALYCREKIFTAMEDLRNIVDETELIVAQDFWPVPGYGEILYSV